MIWAVAGQARIRAIGLRAHDVDLVEGGPYWPPSTVLDPQASRRYSSTGSQATRNAAVTAVGMAQLRADAGGDRAVGVRHVDIRR